MYICICVCVCVCVCMYICSMEKGYLLIKAIKLPTVFRRKSSSGG